MEGTEKQEVAGIWEMGVVAAFDDGEGRDGVGGRKGKKRRVDALCWRALEVWRKDGGFMSCLIGVFFAQTTARDTDRRLERLREL